ncbi:MAG: ABC transporter ATP-binding protein [Candidatus Bipolaricaulaceae bacterium]
MYALRAESLEKGFRKRNGRRVVALHRVSFTVTPGTVYGILGPNGSGKSTLVRILATLLLPERGRAQVFGHDVVREARAVRQLVHRVSTEAAFFKKLSPLENLLYGARLYGVTGRAVAARARELLVQLGIPADRHGRPLEQLSRGQQQKVAVVRALLTPPQVLLLDEPTTGLDPRSKRDVQGLVRQLKQDQATTVLLTTHDMEEADRLCDRVAILDEGQLVAEGTPEELKQRIRTDGKAPTMEDVFFALTGKAWQDAA